MLQISGETEPPIALKNLHANRGGSFFLDIHFCNLDQFVILWTKREWEPESAWVLQ